MIHGLEIIGPEKHWSFDIIWSFWNEIKASPISLCVGLGASSCNLASYAGALTSTTNQTPQTPGPLVQACWVSNYTSEHRQSQLHTPTTFIEIFFKGPGIPISSHCWFLPHPSAALKKTLKKTPTITKNVCTNMHRLNLATSTIVHRLRNYTPASAAACASSVVTPCIQHCCDLFWFEKWLSSR